LKKKTIGGPEKEFISLGDKEGHERKERKKMRTRNSIPCAKNEPWEPFIQEPQKMKRQRFSQELPRRTTESMKKRKHATSQRGKKTTIRRET